MTEPIKKLLKEAKSNKQFDRDMKERDPVGYIKPPGIFADEILKHAYAAGYYGWLLARDKYKRENYFK